MSDRDPMEELFSRSANDMQQRPSLRSWHKLEQRLDNKAQNTVRSKQLISHFRPWYYAAAAIALVLICVIGIRKLKSIDYTMLAQAPESIEELGTAKDADKPIVVDNSYTAIPEGSRSDVLTVRNSSIPRILPALPYRL